ncbi:putative oxidoreductase [Gelidibacter algens]|uniref:Putative oxidoreductase n=1 Tax=Gelidibacter algens TaxID=49280 RepID=A0A1A7R1Q7_9FLAO|nr:DoxX family protein [Gelidibacter algens]OBX25756.1 DoxX family protein [Gelidibacter algens]RAJ21103.1 putative oxidoreductase [Gelidibacter algens]
MKNNLNDLALAILRVSFSGMILTHGIPKINMLLENASGFPDPIGIGSTASLVLAIIGEVVAPIFVLIGFKTRIAAIPVVITMAVAAFVVHINDDFATKEMALLYLLAFVVIALVGAGRYSVDGRK